MSDVSLILSQIESGDPAAAAQLLPLVYKELRQLAAARLAREMPGQTLQATALVHDAYLRLVDTEYPARWQSRGHFFAAAAEAMRRILVENARRKQSHKQGGGWTRLDLLEFDLAVPEPAEDLLALNEALDRLAEIDEEAAKFVKLRYFAGMSLLDAAEVLGVSSRTASRLWAFARTWLRREVEGSGDPGESSSR